MKTTLDKFAAPVLWVSAGVLLSLILFRSEPLLALQPFRGIGDKAGAGVVSSVGGYTVMTSDGGNEDLLLVIDGRSEELFVYRAENQNSVQLYQRLPLSRVFLDARARTGK